MKDGKLQVAVVGAWHVHAKDYAAVIQARKDCTLAYVWDDDKTRGEEFAKAFSCTYIADYDALLAMDTLDAVIITSATDQHPALIVKAAQAKKHIYTEKVLALTSEGCRQIMDSVEKSGVKFCISFPWRCKPGVLAAKEIADSGALGKIVYARVHNAHNGAIAQWLPEQFYNPQECGGGAMIDLGTHSMYILHWLLGKPQKAASVFTNVTGRAVEDNAVTVMQFDGGAIGVAETGFVHTGDMFKMELNGTQGSLLVTDAGEAVRYTCEKTGGEWVTAKTLPERLAHPADQWVDAILYGGSIAVGLEEGLALTEMMEAAYAGIC